jgi:TRAP-type C4-dicarboxylate transport system permease small subunit
MAYPMRCPLCGSDIAGQTMKICPECGGAIRSSSWVIRVISWVEDAVISFILCSMILLVLVQIGLRNFYSTGISGGAEIVRHLVLWVAFLGAAIAAREEKHIRIDLAQRMLPPGFLKNLANTLTGVFTTLICGILLYASIQFIRTDYGLGTKIPFFNMPVWTLELIIPVGYCAVMIRYGVRTGQTFVKFLKGE